jgi:hypothetical protein
MKDGVLITTGNALISLDSSVRLYYLLHRQDDPKPRSRTRKNKMLIAHADRDLIAATSVLISARAAVASAEIARPYSDLAMYAALELQHESAVSVMRTPAARTPAGLVALAAACCAVRETWDGAPIDGTIVEDMLTRLTGDVRAIHTQAVA